MRSLLLLFAVSLTLRAASIELKSGPTLPHKVVKNWAQLLKGWDRSYYVVEIKNWRVQKFAR